MNDLLILKLLVTQSREDSEWQDVAFTLTSDNSSVLPHSINVREHALDAPVCSKMQVHLVREPSRKVYVTTQLSKCENLLRRVLQGSP